MSEQNEKKTPATGTSPQRQALTFLVCFAVYLAVLEAFLAVPLFNDVVQVRPASALGPVLGLFFGLPGVFGCALANLASDALHGLGTPAMLAGFFIIQVFYNGLPRWVWYGLNRNTARPYPCFESAEKTAGYLVIVLVDGILVNLAAFAFVGAPTSELQAHGVRILNNVWMLFYVGMPLLFFLERSKLAPVPPRWIHASWRPISEPNLTQRLVIWFTIGAAVLMLIISLIAVVTQGGRIESVILTVYVQVAALSVPIYLLMFTFLHVLETRFTRPVEILAADQRSFVARVEEKAEQGMREMFTDIDEQGADLRYELRELFDSTNDMRRDMAGFIKRVYEYTVEHQRTATELDVARQIQLGALPHDFKGIAERYNLDIAGLMHPAREVGGDFYDVFEVGDGKVAFVVGDVSGKGVPAALFMMRAQSLLRQHLSQAKDLGDAFTLVNRALCERNDALLFVTAFACVVDTSTGQLHYANAGHNPPVFLQTGTRSLLRCTPGLVLGAMDTVRYRECELSFSPGDGLMLYTDGVTEAQDRTGALFGEEHMLAILNGASTDVPAPDCGPSRAQHAVDELEEAVRAFAAGAPQSDDITMLAFRWNLPTHRLQLEPADSELERLFAFLEPLCGAEGMTSSMLTQLKLAVEEAFVNIAHYGFPDGQPRFPVELEVAVDEREKRMHLVLADRGIPYNPLEHAAKTVDLDDDEREGGLGILLMRAYLDDIRYIRAGGRNILRMTKNFV